MDRASELGVACQVPNMPANSRSTPRQLPAPAGFYWRVAAELAGTSLAGGSGKSTLRVYARTATRSPQR